MQHRRLTALLSVTCLSLGYVACGNSSDDPSGSGGAPTTGGAASGGRSNTGGLGGEIVIPIGSGGKTTEGPGAGGTGGNAPDGSLSVCELSSGPSVGDPTKSLLIEDFEADGFEGNGLQGGFYAFTDGTGTQTPTGVSLSYSARPGGGSALHVVGSGQTVWGSGFGAILSSQGEGAECLFDGSAYTGFSFWAKGSIVTDGTGSTDRPGLLRTKVLEKDVVPASEGGNCPDDDACYDAAGANLTLTDCWQLYSYRFADLLPEGWGRESLPLDLDQLYTIEFGVAHRHDYDVWIDDLSFFVGTKPTAEPVCDDGMGGMGGMTP